jgi:hypothetical protein
MEDIHSLLKRQLKKHLGVSFSLPDELQLMISGKDIPHSDTLNDYQ